MSSFASILESQLEASVPNPQLPLIKHLKQLHPNSQHISILQCSEAAFPLSAYLQNLNITPTVIEPETHTILQYDHGQKLTHSQVVAGVIFFAYDSVKFQLYKATWYYDWKNYNFYHLVFDGADDAVGQKLASEVYQWANSLKEEIWVFEGGCWTKSKLLYKAIQPASWDTVVLHDAFKDGLRRDTKTFFSSQDIYRSLNITWKRGILLLGPPGNGKTESIKALLKESTVEALYVKSFTTQHGPEQGVRGIFEHARKHSPCILVLEDLDAMVTSEARSFFLNEVDGLAKNDGILTIATTNHPERIDDAILNRPSRFDVKYDFKLPDIELRKTFASRWISNISNTGPGTGIVIETPEETARAVAEKTEGWSFAFLKELFVSFLLRVAHDKSLLANGVERPTETSDAVLLRQVDLLAAQIIKVKDISSPEQSEKKSMNPRLVQRAQEASISPHVGANF